jgi:dihydrolipoamide dehydrogenase
MTNSAQSPNETVMPARRQVDVAIIGAGTAGLAAYHAAVERTRRVLLIEAGPLGTTCARVGCMPSKLLLAAAEAAHNARHAGVFGVRCSSQVDGQAVMERVRRERDRFVGLVVDSIEKIPCEHKLTGRARFTAPGLLQVGEHCVEAAAVVIAVGSIAQVPDMFQAVGDRLVTSDGRLRLDRFAGFRGGLWDRQRRAGAGPSASSARRARADFRTQG